MGSQDASRPDPTVTRTSSAAFEFVRELAVELSSDSIELPSYPEVAVQIQRVLGEQSASADRVVRILGAEPVLAARVLKLANSAALNPGGRPISDLRTAVTRLGFDSLRTTVVSFAVSQLKQAQEFKSVERQLSALWQQSVWMAALAFVLARRGGRFNPETSMLAGLVEGIGRLYILTRASRHPALFGDMPTYQGIVRDWQANISRALLEHWNVADEIVTAVHGAETAGEDERGAPMLADVIVCASILLSCKESPDMLEAKFASNRAARRLGMSGEMAQTVLRDSMTEITALQRALGH